MNVRFFLIVNSLVTVLLSGIGFSQTDEEKAAVIAAIGEQAGEALLSTHGAVNALPTIRSGGVFPEAEVKELATSYRESSELVLRLVRGQSASPDQERISKGAALLVEQAKAMEKIIHEGTMEIPVAYTTLQEKTMATLFGRDVPTPSGDNKNAAVKEIAESLRDGRQGVESFQPSAEQIQKITTTPEAAAKLTVYANGLYESIPEDAIGAKPGQTEILVRGPSLDDLPGGYGEVMGNFREGIEIYGFKYVEPGETLGMAFDGLFEVEGEWIFIPKAWRAFSQ